MPGSENGFSPEIANVFGVFCDLNPLHDDGCRLGLLALESFSEEVAGLALAAFSCFQWLEKLVFRFGAECIFSIQAWLKLCFWR